MAEIAVGVEVDPNGQALAWVQEWFGCTAHGTGEAEALQAVPEALRDFWNWLREHGEDGVPSPDEPIEVIRVERVSVSSDLHDADSEGFFVFDSEPLSAQDVSRARRYRAYARSDLLGLLDSVDTQALTVPVGRSGRSVAATLVHVAYADLWYAQRASGAHQDQRWLKLLLSELRHTADAQVEVSLQIGQAARPLPWHNAGREELWTAQKTLRRFVWHDLLHLRAIQRALRASG